jgi:hypothetical protein
MAFLIPQIIVVIVLALILFIAARLKSDQSVAKAVASRKISQ